MAGALSLPPAVASARPADADTTATVAPPTEVKASDDTEGAVPEPGGDEPAPKAEEADTPPRGSTDPLQQSLIEEAATHFVEGRRLFTRGEYVDAAVEFERSYSAYPSGEALYNVGLSYEKGQRPVDAIVACQRYLELSDCKTAGELHCARKRDEVTETTARLRQRVGVLEIVVEDGVDLRAIRVDGREIPIADFPIFLEPGSIEIKLLGRERDQVRTRTAKLEPGQRTSLLVGPFFVPPPVVIRDPDDPDPGPSPEDLARRRLRLRVSFWTGLGATVASGAAVGVLGGLTSLYKRRFDARCKGEGVDCSGTTHPTDREQGFNRLKLATNVMVGVTAGVGMVTAILGVFAFSGPKAATSRASTQRKRFEMSAQGLLVRW